LANDASGRDLGWFFDAYLYHAALPELVEERSGKQLKLRWKLKDGGAFPMPLEVRVNGSIEKLAMTDGGGELTLPDHASYTIDPYSRILRQEARIDEWQRAEEERKKKAKK
jgi:aminopeptidase N